MGVDGKGRGDKRRMGSWREKIRSRIKRKIKIKVKKNSWLLSNIKNLGNEEELL